MTFESLEETLNKKMFGIDKTLFLKIRFSVMSRNFVVLAGLEKEMVGLGGGDIGGGRRTLRKFHTLFNFCTALMVTNQNISCRVDANRNTSRTLPLTYSPQGVMASVP